MNQDHATTIEESIEEAISDRANCSAPHVAESLTFFIAEHWPPNTTVADLVALRVELEVTLSISARDIALKTLAAIRARTQSIQE